MSKFYEVYNLIMEEINKKSEFDIIKDRCYRALKELEASSSNDIFSSGMAQLVKDNKSLNEYRVICSGKNCIKLVKNKTITGSGQYKMNLSNINLNKIMSNSYFNAIFYVLHMQKLNSEKNNIPFEIFTPSSAGEKEQKEEAQIENFKDELQKYGENGVLIQDPNDNVRGPFNNIKKTEGNKPKSDATIYNDDGKTNDKLYVSLKSSDGKPVKPGAFNQFGGKNDLGGDDDKILQNSEFIADCYRKIKLLFEKLQITDYDFLQLKNYLANYNKEHNTKFLAIFAFLIPDDNKDLQYLYKTKYGMNFGNEKSSPTNVDVLIDGDIEIKNDELKGSTHTEWNPILYKDSNFHDDEISKNYKLAIAFASQLNKGKFKEFQHCRFNTFPANSGRVKIYFDRTKELFKEFGIE